MDHVGLGAETQRVGLLLRLRPGGGDRGVAAASTALSLAVAYRCELELLEAERGKLPRDGTSMVLVMIYS